MGKYRFAYVGHHPLTDPRDQVDPSRHRSRHDGNYAQKQQQCLVKRRRRATAQAVIHHLLQHKTETQHSHRRDEQREHRTQQRTAVGPHEGEKLLQDAKIAAGCALFSQCILLVPGHVRYGCTVA
jgi:hypothetical protein